MLTNDNRIFADKDDICDIDRESMPKAHRINGQSSMKEAVTGGQTGDSMVLMCPTHSASI